MIRYTREDIKLYTTNELSRRLNTSESTVLRAHKRGLLKGKKIGEKLLFHQVDVEDYLVGKRKPRLRWLLFKKAQVERIEYLEERIKELTENTFTKKLPPVRKQEETVSKKAYEELKRRYNLLEKQYEYLDQRYDAFLDKMEALVKQPIEVQPSPQKGKTTTPSEQSYQMFERYEELYEQRDFDNSPHRHFEIVEK